MIPKSALSIIDVVVDQQEVTIAELAAKTGYSSKQIYRTVDVLSERDELAEHRGTKQRRYFRPGSGPIVTAYQRLALTAGHVDWDEILTPSLLRVCWYLDEPRKLSTIAERLGRTRRAVYSAVEPMKGRALLLSSDAEYELAENIQPLHELADAYARQSHRLRIEQTAGGGVIEWYEPTRAVVRPRNQEETKALSEADEWSPTGLGALEKYGHKFFLSGEPLYWYGPAGEPSAEQVVCHVIQSDPEPRRVSYAMLLIVDKDLNKERISELAEWYDIEDVVTEITLALAEEDDWQKFNKLPGRREFDQLKTQYGV